MRDGVRDRGFHPSGKIKLFAIDSVDGRVLVPLGEFTRRTQCAPRGLYGYVVNEGGSISLRAAAMPVAVGAGMATGCSMGAYHAVNFFSSTRISSRARSRSPASTAGSSRIRTERADLPAVYFNSPLAYLPGFRPLVPGLVPEKPHRRLCAGAWEQRGHRGHAGLATASGRIDPGLGRLLGHDVNHDWPWWYVQMNYFLGKLYGEV